MANFGMWFYFYFFTFFFFFVFCLLNQHWCDVGSGGDVFIQYSASLTSAMLFLETSVVGVHLHGEKNTKMLHGFLDADRAAAFQSVTKAFQRFVCNKLGFLTSGDHDWGLFETWYDTDCLGIKLPFIHPYSERVNKLNYRYLYLLIIVETLLKMQTFFWTYIFHKCK